MKKSVIILTMIAFFAISGQAKEYHVSKNGNDKGTGSESAPFKTINQAAQVAYPGDVITVHAGVYREWVNPPRDCEIDDKRIAYRAAPGEHVDIKGSEQITVDGNVYYRVRLPYPQGKNNLILSDIDPEIQIEDNGNDVYMTLTLKGIDNLATEVVNTEKLGNTVFTRQAYEYPDGTQITVDRDFFGKNEPNALRPVRLNR